jgi:hypothetical protein
MQKVLQASLQCADDLFCTLELEADEIDYDVGAERSDARTEFTGAFGRLPIERDAFDVLPRSRGAVGFPPTAAYRDNVMTRGNQPRDQVAADMSRGANHYGAQDRAPVCGRFPQNLGDAVILRSSRRLPF